MTVVEAVPQHPVEPVSWGQQSLWFLNRLEPDAATYNVPVVYRFRGSVDEEALHCALVDVVRRHEPLRTVFHSTPRGVEPRVLTEVEFPFDVVEPSEAALEALLDRESRLPFDLETGPLLRAVFVRTGDEPLLLIVLQHICSDGWSLDVLDRELAEAYRARLEGRPAVLPALPARYADFARAQRFGDYGDRVAELTSRLRGAPELIALPTDRARPVAQTSNGATLSFRLAAPTTAGVRRLAARAGVTAYTTLLAAFGVLLHRYTGSDDIVVGTPATLRDRPEWEDLVGYFVNVVPLRFAVRPRSTFQELLGHVGEVARGTFTHQDVPLELLVDRLGRDRSAGHPPVVQVLFGLHEDSAAITFGTAEASRSVRPNGTAKFDLTWSVYDNGELRAEVEFNTDLFDRSTVERMATHWQRLLRFAVERPDTPVVDLPVLTVAEERVARPHEPRPRAERDLLHQRFARAATQFADRIAVQCGDVVLTYRELDFRSNRLARHLRALGVGPGDRVGLRLDRGTAVVESVLAVLKTGAAYVPLDLAWPAARAGFVLADAGVRVLVTDQPDLRGGDLVVVDLDADADAIGRRQAAGPAVDGEPGGSAYVIYTSGSTGQPKGVQVSHGNVLALVDSGLPHFGPTEHDVWTLLHSYAFDVSVWEMWGALLHGGRLVVVPFDVSRSPEELATLLADESVTMLSLTPSALDQLTAELRAAERPMPALRWVMLAGEQLTPGAVEQWFALPGLRAPLCNLYGTTETTVHATTYDVVGSAARFSASWIGRPMPHLSAIVLDPSLGICPVGVPGEVYVGGYGLADGYLNRPGLTAERFVPNPFSAVRGARLYRTGDIARLRADGTLESMGRRDDQVKIRGFRIELGDVEAAVRQHPAVGRCVVVVRQLPGGHRSLAAYATPQGDAALEPAALRDHLKLVLPAYMVPATIDVLDTLPSTPNGKVDKGALPEPRHRARRSGERDRSATEAERILAEAWQEVLGVAEVGRRDNFFHLGGDSIRTVQVAASLRERGWYLPVAALFATPTIVETAASLTRLDVGRTGTSAFDVLGAADVATVRERWPDAVDAYPMASMQLAMVYHMELEGDTRAYHNVNSYLVSSRLDETAFRRAAADVVDRHPVLRSSLHIAGFSEPVQVVHREAPGPVRFEDLGGLDGPERDAAVVEVFERERDTPFDLARAPLLRITVQRLTDSTFQLTVAEHHAVVDGWSLTSLVTELLERHAGLSRNLAAPPSPRPRSTFRDFVARERAAVSSEASIDFWRRKAVGADGSLLLPARGESGPHVVEEVLPARFADLLEAAARRTGTTAKSVAFAAHTAALAALTGRTRVTTGLSVNGRLDEVDGVDACGLFLNTVPVSAELSGRTWAQLVHDLHREEVDLFPHRRVPAAQIVRLMPSRRLDSDFVFLRFHSLGRLTGEAGRIVDDRVGCEPTMRHEPTNFPLAVGLVQDPITNRLLLSVEHRLDVVSRETGARFAEWYASALRLLAAEPDAECERWLATA